MVDYSQEQHPQSDAIDYGRGEGYGEIQPKKKKFWWGCCGGCLGLVVVAAAVFAVALYMLLRSEPVVPAEAFLMPDADGFAVVQIDPGDEGLVELLTALAKDPPEGLDITDEEREVLKQTADDVPERMARMAPINLVSLLYHLDEPEEKEPHEIDFGELDDSLSFIGEWLERGQYRRFHKGVSVSLSRAGGLMRLMVRLLISDIADREGEAESYRDVRIGKTPDGMAIAAVDNNFLAADRQNILHAWIDMLRDSTAADRADYGGPERLENMYQRIRRPAPFYFAVSNRQGEVRSLAESFIEVYEQANPRSGPNLDQLPGLVDFVTADMDAVGGAFYIIGPERAELDIYAECRDAEHAEEVGNTIVKMLQYLAEEEQDMDIEFETDRNLAHVRFIRHNFKDFLHSLADK